MRRCRHAVGVVAVLLCVVARSQSATLAEAKPTAAKVGSAPHWPEPPAAGDDSAGSLRSYGQRVIATFGGGYRNVPLDVKARFFEWQIWRYHQAPTGQVYNRVRLADEPGQRPVFVPGPDTSTWNGALLAALSYKYAATGDAETLRRIASLLRGFELFLEVTGQPGLLARSIALEKATAEPGMQTYTAPDGQVYYYRSDAAKGTFNQVVGGYATLMMRAAHDLPPEARQMARRQLADMVWHVIRHDYHLTERNGQRTRYGDLTPLVGVVRVPFNAQVAYMIVAAGHYFPPEDAKIRAAIEREFGRLRDRYHVYYERPWRSLIRPQRVGASPLVKGMNDRNHVTNAAFVGLMLDIDWARNRSGVFDCRFLYRLGRTMYWSMQRLYGQHNSLCNFMWAAVLGDQQVFDCVIDHKPNTARARLEQMTVNGVEQLRRFKLNRFSYHGREHILDAPQWVDAYRPDDYYWKCNPRAVWEVTAGPTNDLYCAIDFLHAYWLMRYYKIDRRPEVMARHAEVLAPTPAVSAAMRAATKATTDEPKDDDEAATAAPNETP